MIQKTKVIPHKKDLLVLLKRYCLFPYFFLILLSTDLFIHSSEVSATTRDEIIAVSIYRLAEHIRWANESKINEYKIHIIEDENNILANIQQIAESETLHDKPILVSNGQDTKIPPDTHLIYLSKEKANIYPLLLNRIQGTNTLIISTNVTNNRIIMLNLLDEKNGEISFEINKANIINQNLGVDPDIILLGGSEIDVARLYREGEENFQRAQKDLLKLQNDMLNIEQDKQSLLASITKQQKEVNDLVNSTKLQKKEVNSLQTTIASQKSMMSRQNRQLKETSDKLVRQQESLKIAKHEYNKLLTQTQAQESSINKQKIELDKRSIQLDKQKLEIDSRREILKSQKNLISKQQVTINEQKTDLVDNEVVIATQKNYLLLLSLSAGLAILLTLVIFRGSRRNKITNQQLTEQKNLLESAAQSLEDAKNQAIKANQSKSIFLANMSHELRTPLNAVLGFSEIMARDPASSARQRGNLDIINRSGQHLLSMINHVLDLSKIEAGKIEIETNVIDLKQTVTDVANMIQVRADSRGLDFSLTLDENLPNNVKLDANKISQVLINLLGNAVKFAEKGLVSLEVSNTNSNNNCIINFTVKDTGPGVAFKQQERIFEPFVQLGHSNETSAHQTGTGLGLAISQQLVQLMGGRIKLESIEGKGSTFSFSIPTEVIENEYVKHEPTPRTVISLAPNETPRRILIVEDQMENRLLLRSILESVGFNVRESIHGADGVKLFEQWKPDLIWMDLRMPIMDGYEATKKIRQLPGGKSVKIVALTAGALKEQIPKIYASGCDEIVYKPYQSHEIFDVMAQQLSIQYRYKKQNIGETSTEKKPNIIDFSFLDSKFVVTIRTAAQRLDQNQLVRLLEEIRSDHPDLHNGLMALINDFRYDTIIELCESSINHNKKLSP